MTRPRMLLRMDLNGAKTYLSWAADRDACVGKLQAYSLLLQSLLFSHPGPLRPEGVDLSAWHPRCSKVCLPPTIPTSTTKHSQTSIQTSLAMLTFEYICISPTLPLFLPNQEQIWSYFAELSQNTTGVKRCSLKLKL